MASVFWVFVGGGMGSLCRFGIARLISLLNSDFPYATLIANVLSCILLGYLVGLSMRGQLSSPHKLLLMTGFCGGFSTFSTFSNESYSLMQNGQYAMVLANIGGSVVLGLIAIYIGLRLSI